MSVIDLCVLIIFFADLIYFPFWLKGMIEKANK